METKGISLKGKKCKSHISSCNSEEMKRYRTSLVLSQSVFYIADTWYPKIDEFDLFSAPFIFLSKNIVRDIYA
jgi:hypothetical protein